MLVTDLGLIGHSRYLYFAFLQSLPYLLLQTIPVWASFKGYGFDLGLAEAFALMLFLRLGSAVPQAPGNVGLVMLITKEVLEHVYNVVPDGAARFSLVLWGHHHATAVDRRLCRLVDRGSRHRRSHPRRGTGRRHLAVPLTRALTA